jgi:hypothetical protein
MSFPVPLAPPARDDPRIIPQSAHEAAVTRPGGNQIARAASDGGYSSCKVLFRSNVSFPRKTFAVFPTPKVEIFHRVASLLYDYL